MDESKDEQETAVPKRDLQWISTTATLLGIGSLGPANVYFAATDPHYFDKLSGWRLWILPFGAWLLTGLLVQGLTALWLGGIRGDPNWSKHMDSAGNWWFKLGFWLIGIGVAIAVAALVFSGVASFLSALDKGTVLISLLLLMILIALLRIGDQMKRR